MSLKRYEKWALTGIGVLAALLLAAILVTGGWDVYFRQRPRTPSASNPSTLVDSRPLTTAQTLAALAATPSERQYAEDVLRLGDHAVDLNFSAALHDATENPAPANAQTIALDQRNKAASDAVDTDKDRVTELTRRLAAASAAAKNGIQDQLALEQAQLSLDQDALQDAQEDLARAGGDNQARIQQMMDEHNASEAHSSGAQTVGADAPSIELTKERNIKAEVEAWLSLQSKNTQLLLAQREALANAVRLNTSHDALEKKLASEAQQNTASHPELSGSLSATNSQSGQNATTAPLTLIHQMTADQKDLASFDTRIGTEQQLAAAYGNWASLVETRKQIFLRRFLTSVLWILVIALFVLFLHRWVQRLFDNINLERRQLHTLRAVVLFAVRTLGLATILVIIFGVPTNFATAVGLIGAGLAVGLQDFIVGFFGWFILIGRDGIRVGDWVEINGVGGEVLEVGLFQTILLESGTLNDAGRPTGRKVSFVNSYAVQGHYFNFSTSGQWLWDEVEIQIPANVEPYEMSEAFQKIAVSETATNARLAEEEWKRGTPLSAKQSFSAVPSFSLRPTASGVSVLVRYITRVNERHEVRERIYRDAVELLRNTKTGESPVLPLRPANPVTVNTAKEPA